MAFSGAHRTRLGLFGASRTPYAAFVSKASGAAAVVSNLFKGFIAHNMNRMGLR